jgi:hypothetical protein
MDPAIECGRGSRAPRAPRPEPVESARTDSISGSAPRAEACRRLPTPSPASGLVRRLKSERKAHVVQPPDDLTDATDRGLGSTHRHCPPAELWTRSLQPVEIAVSLVVGESTQTSRGRSPPPIPAPVRIRPCGQPQSPYPHEPPISGSRPPASSMLAAGRTDGRLRKTLNGKGSLPSHPSHGKGTA